MSIHNAPNPNMQVYNHILNLERVRLIDNDGKQVGIIRPKEAISIAREKQLDLIEVASDANPPVVKIVDYGKYKYRQSKREKARTHKAEKTKEIKLSTTIAQHDYEFKKRHAEKFLQAGSKIIFTIQLKGRQVTHPEIGIGIMKRLADDLSEIGVILSPPQLKGRNISMTIIPKTG